MRRSSLTWLLGLTYLSGVTSLVIPDVEELDRKPGADFASVRTRLTRDYSQKRPDQPTKYFHEAIDHYDGRFADNKLKYAPRREALSALVQSYLQTMAGIEADTWIVHGTLIGWWWNQRILPWDSDVDVMVSEDTMDHLARYYNMTVHDYTVPTTQKSRSYMLEINPHHTEAAAGDGQNKIDGRWIDTETGLYIDITTARRTEVNGIPYLASRDGHKFREQDVFPLRDGLFEGMPVRVPRAYEELLRNEYGAEVMTQLQHKSHRFDRESWQWVPIGDPDELEEYESRTIALANAGLASSGDKTQKWEWSGEWNRWVPSPSAAAAPVIQATDHDQVALNSIAASGSEAARKFLEANRNIQPGFR